MIDRKRRTRSEISIRDAGVGLGWLLAFLLLAACRPSLGPEDVVLRPPPGAKPDVFRVVLAPGTYLQAVVFLQEVELTLRLRDPQGRTLLELDSVKLPGSFERIRWLATSGGTYLLEIVSPPTVRAYGSYEIYVKALRPADAADRTAFEASQYLNQARRFEKEGRAADGLAAARHAFSLWQALGDRPEQVASLALLGRLYALSQEESALRSLQQALALVREAGVPDRDLEASLHRMIGETLWALGRQSEARDKLSQAAALFGSIGQKRRQSDCLRDRARIYQLEGDLQHAREAYLEAQQVLVAVSDPSAALDLFCDLVNFDQSLGLFARALADYKEAEKFRNKKGLPENSLLLDGLVQTYAALGNWASAKANLDKSLAINRRKGNAVGQAITLNLLANGFLEDLRHLDEVERISLEALDLAERGRDPLQRAYALGNLAICAVHKGRYREARERFEQQREVFRQRGDRTAEVQTFLDQARAALRLGLEEEALSLTEQAGRILEDLRRKGKDPELRTQAFAARQSLYQARIDILMEMAAREPRRVKEAFIAAEEARARTQLDELAAAEPPASGADREWGEPAEIPSIQRTLLGDGDTLLLSYWLGGDKSFLWLVSRDNVTPFILRGRREIETQVNTVLDLWSTSSSGTDLAAQREEERKLGNLLLGPVANRLGHRRLLIVSDGLLQKLPFDAVPEPGQNGPLLLRHRIVHLPSASFAVRLHDRPRRSPTRGAAIFAVQDFRQGEGEHWLSLPHTRDEADAICHIFRDCRQGFFVGPDATVARATSGELAAYRYLHFATHGLLDLEHPQRSGLKLSYLDARGREIPDTLSAAQIYDLHLSADLVALSACETALGQSVPGEGLLGLPRAFFHAGAARVLVSLWPVADRSTAELMSAFYAGLIRQNLPPAEALRRAQLAMRLKYPEPYHWAGFILQGDGS